MPDPQLEQLFLDHLPQIDRAASFIARRHGLSPDDAGDFVAEVRAKFIQAGYEPLRRFRKESSIGTYLAAVVAGIYHDYAAARWGRWRPSAAAQRLGPPAPRLERLVARMGMSLAEAGETLRTAGETQLNDAGLARLLAQLPRGAPLRRVEVGAVVLEGRPSEASDGLGEDAVAQRDRILAALNLAVEGLEPDDRLLIRMHFWGGATVQSAARALGVEAKPLYKRLDRLRGQLKLRLEHSGVSGAEVAELLAQESA
jgi:RNA polymerase sigma factor for flagellar operon FliA